MQIGEAFVGEGPEAAHVNTVLGHRVGPAGTAWATALATPSSGHAPFVAVLRPGVPAQPMTLFVNKAAHQTIRWIALGVSLVLPGLLELLLGVERAHVGDELVRDAAEGDLGDVHRAVADERQQQVERAIEHIERDAEPAVCFGRAIRSGTGRGIRSLVCCSFVHLRLINAPRMHGTAALV